MSEHTKARLVFEFGLIRTTNGINIARMDRNEPGTAPTERDANARRFVHLWNAWPDVVELMRTLGADDMYYAMSDEVHQAHTELENILGEEIGNG